MFGRVDRYILRLVLKPMIVVISVALMLLLLDNLLRLFDFTMTKGQPAWVVTTMLAALLPEYLGLAIPIGVLVGFALTIRRLAIEHELEAMFNAGLSHFRVLRTPILLATGLMLATFLTIGFIQPKAEYTLQNLLYRVRTGQFGMSIKSGEFLHLTDSVTMRVQEVDKTRQLLKSVFLKVRQADKSNLALTALSGQLYRGGDGSHHTVILHLEDGVAIHTTPEAATPDVVRFSNYDYPIHLPDPPSFRKRGNRNNELTIGELWSLGHDQGADADARRVARGHFHRRLIQSALVLALPFLALAMGIPPNRTTSVVGLVMGLASYIVMLKSLDFVVASSLPHLPEILWGMFAGYAAFCFGMYRATVRGGHPFNSAAGFVAVYWSRLLEKLGAAQAVHYRRHAPDHRPLG